MSRLSAASCLSLVIALGLAVEGCGPSSSRDDLFREHFPHAGLRANAVVGNVRVYTSVHMTPLEEFWAVGSVIVHTRANPVTVPAVEVYCYAPDVTRLTSLQRMGEAAYSTPGTTILNPNGRTAGVSLPQIHVTAGPKVSLPLLSREIRHVNDGHVDPHRTHPTWVLTEQASLLIAQQIQATR